MAAIENERDLLLQATSPRVIPIPIPIDRVEGLPGALADINTELGNLGTEVDNLLNNSGDLVIRATSTNLTSSSSTTLTAVRKNGLTGVVIWEVFAGVATIVGTGDTVTVAGSTITGTGATIKASIGSKEAYVTLNKTGVLSTQDAVNLTTQVTGQLANSNVSGLGALALLNTVNLNTQTTGALNGVTQVTNLGNLAYVNSLAANQIGAGTLAAGVIYAGTINADNITSGTLTGRTIQTSTTGRRVVIDSVDNAYRQYDSDGVNFATIDESGIRFRSGKFATEGLSVIGTGTKVGISVTSDTTGIYSYGTTVGVYGRSDGVGGIGVRGYGITSDVSCEGSGVVYLKPRSSLPTPRAGAICYYSGWLCFSNGSGWLTSAGNTIT